MLLQNFQKITTWTQSNLQEEVNQLKQNTNTDAALFTQIEAEISAQLPDAFKEIYKNYSGEIGEERGTFLGVQLMDLTEILEALKFSKTFVKSEGRTIAQPEESNKKIEKIIQIFASAVPAGKKWEKMIFGCSPLSVSNPHWFENQKEEGESIELGEKLFEITAVCQELHDLEKEAWNWDDLEITAYANGQFSVERKETDWNEIMNFSCLPEKTIQLKYFHYKWVPLFHDFGGNYIGIDLDPAENGTQGQVIIFGRDEALMPVLANDLPSFFEWILAEIGRRPQLFTSENHLHEILKAAKGFPNELIGKD